MREIDLDFQPRRPGLLPVVLLLAGLLLAADGWLEDSALRDNLNEARSRFEQAQRRAERLDAGQRNNRPENVFSADESKALRQAISAIRVDWEALYHAIDQSASEDVSLLAIRPSVTAGIVQISGEARDMAAALAFVESLRREPLAQIVLLSHQIKPSDPQHPVIFEISATWLTAS